LKLHEQNRYKGGVIARRNNPKCYSKQKQKEIHQCRKTSFSRKHLSLESSYDLLGISKNLKNLLKIGTSGAITRITPNKSFSVTECCSKMGAR